MDIVRKEIIPEYVFIIGAIGIIFLFISMIMWFVFYFYYYEGVNDTVDAPKNKKPGYDAVGYTNLTVGSVGFVFCCFLIYGLFIYNTFELKIPMRGDPIIKIEKKDIIQNKQPYTNLRYNEIKEKKIAPIDTSF